MDVARDRPDVMRGRDPPPAAFDPAQDQHDPEMRELVIGQPDRAPAELVEDVVERIGVDGRGKAVADRGGPHRDPRRLAPGVRRQVIRQLGCSRTVVSARTGSPPLRATGWAVPGQPSSDACGSHSKVSVSPASSMTRTAGGRKSSRAASSVDLPVPCARAATTIGTRASTSSQSCAASSASSVPDRISSTIDRGSGGGGRKAQRPRAGENSATGGAYGPGRARGQTDARRPAPYVARGQYRSGEPREAHDERTRTRSSARREDILVVDWPIAGSCPTHWHGPGTAVRRPGRPGARNSYAAHAVAGRSGRSRCPASAGGQTDSDSSTSTGRSTSCRTSSQLAEGSRRDDRVGPVRAGGPTAVATPAAAGCRNGARPRPAGSSSRPDSAIWRIRTSPMRSAPPDLPRAARREPPADRGRARRRTAGRRRRSRHLARLAGREPRYRPTVRGS